MISFDLQKRSVLSSSNTIGMQDVSGLMRVHFQAYIARSHHQVKQFTHPLLSTLSNISFTEIDRAFLIWGAITLSIFSLAQFSTLGWSTQAVIDAAFTSFGIISTSQLTWRLARSENLSWVVCLWAALMAGGMIATAYGIFCGVSIILTNLCPLWLGLCALGYGLMGLGLGSRSFSTASVVHLAAIPFLEQHPSHMFFESGLVITLTLFFFSFVPWDMKESEAEELCGMKPKE